MNKDVRQRCLAFSYLLVEYHAYVRPAAIAVLPIIEKSAETAKRIPAEEGNRNTRKYASRSEYDCTFILSVKEWKIFRVKMVFKLYSVNAVSAIY
ncbi:MAG: hypothetical protein VZT48_10455 [Bulleidia sp.]|nr:hypothetical protein [Bulleidia sp.]